MTQVIAVSAGSEHVGTTTTAAGLAVILARRGHKTCLLDADWGPNSISALLAYHPDKTLVDLLDGNAAMAELVQKNINGMDVIFGDAAAEHMSALTAEQMRLLAEQLSDLEAYDYLIIDVAAGTDRTVMAFLEACDALLLVMTHNRKTQDSAYAVLKHLRDHHVRNDVMVVVNQCRNTIIGSYAYARFREITQFYLQESLPLLGLVCGMCQTNETPGQRFEKMCASDSELNSIVDKLLLRMHQASTQSLHSFWQRYLTAAGVAFDNVEAVHMQANDTFDELEAQLDTLSNRVEVLIERVNRCQDTVSHEPDKSPSPLPNAPAKQGADYWLAASKVEPIIGHDTATSSLYWLRQSQGSSIRCGYYAAPADNTAALSQRLAQAHNKQDFHSNP